MSVGQEDRVSQVEQAGPVSEPVGVEGLPSGRQRRRPLVLVGFVGLVVLGALLAVLGYNAATSTRDVVAVRESVAKGETIEKGDLRTVAVSVDASVATIPAEQAGRMVEGRRAAVDLPKGSLVSEDSIAQGTVPGAGTSVVGVTLPASQLPGELEKARMLSEKTGAAVVVWQGYAPPPLLTDAISPHRAAAGADDLAMFQAALDERYPDAQKTVVSHSYGTLLATKAASTHGLLADDLWILGSAGVAASHASELTLAGPEATVHVVDSPTDPILLLRSGPSAALGASPSYVGWGGERLPGVRGGHCDYFTDPAFVSALQQRSDRATENSLPWRASNETTFEEK